MMLPNLTSWDSERLVTRWLALFERDDSAQRVDRDEDPVAEAQCKAELPPLGNAVTRNSRIYLQ